VLPPGKVVSAQRPAPMRWWMTYPMTIVDTIFKALAPAVPTPRHRRPTHADLVVANINGRNPRDGKLFNLSRRVIGGGWGAKHGEDGHERHGSRSTMATRINGPSEQVEAKYPLIVERYALREDSAVPASTRRARHRDGGARARRDQLQTRRSARRLPALGPVRRALGARHEVSSGATMKKSASRPARCWRSS